MRERAYFLIQQKIVSGELMAGAAISEVSLAKELNSSRTPIREAMGQLVSEGVLEQIPNRGTIVTQFDRQDILELYELREALEVYAVEKVSQREIDSSDRQRLYGFVDRCLQRPTSFAGIRDMTVEPLELRILGERGCGQIE